VGHEFAVRPGYCVRHGIKPLYPVVTMNTMFGYRKCPVRKEINRSIFWRVLKHSNMLNVPDFRTYSCGVERMLQEFQSCPAKTQNVVITKEINSSINQSLPTSF